MNIVVAVPLDPQLAAILGKRGSENSITFYNGRAGDVVIVALAPTSIEEKFFAAAECMLLSSSIVISTSDVDRLFGEIVVGASLLEGRKVILTDDNNVDGMVSGLGAKFEYSPRDRAIERLQVEGAQTGEGKLTRIDIDKAFPVKGVGTVVLGIVTAGTVHVHDSLFTAGGKSVQVRSIQSQDQDVQLAGRGTRVGLALKGLEHDQIDKGELLTSVQVKPVREIRASVKQARIAQEQIAQGGSYFLVSNFNCISCKVTSAEKGSVSLSFDREAQLVAGDEFLLLRNKAPRIFASGRVL